MPYIYVLRFLEVSNVLNSKKKIYAGSIIRDLKLSVTFKGSCKLKEKTTILSM